MTSQLASGSIAAIVEEPIDVTALYQAVADPEMGAVSLFLGVVRNSNVGRPVTGIDYDAYRPMASSELERVVLEVQDAIPGSRIAAVHRVGTLGIGDVSIAIAAAHPHRAQAIEAARQVIELVKVRVPIWKLEHYVNGDREWVDPSGAPR
jgi:molybdopterin synthase catalytic subunit